MSFPAIIRNEMRLERRPLPDRLEDCQLDDQIIQLRRDGFLFTTPLGTRFHYEKGAGIAVEQGSKGNPAETDLFYNGTVYGAVAWLNGLLPLHASSVVHDDRVIAFTGQSGEGKSTLAAALANHGFAHRSDDVLLVDPLASPIMAWPDRHRIKLCEDAFDLTGAGRLNSIEPGASKYFASVGNASDASAESGLPLTDLIVLTHAESGPPSLTPCKGTSKVPVILQAMYRIEIPAGLGEATGYRTSLMRLGTDLRVWTLKRQRDRARFAEDIEWIADRIAQL